MAVVAAPLRAHQHGPAGREHYRVEPTPASVTVPPGTYRFGEWNFAFNSIKMTYLISH
jgi:hypothetical protein